MRYAYPAALTRDQDGRWVLSFYDLQGAHTDGATRDEALAQASDCLEMAVAATLDADEALPPPAPARADEALVPLSLEMAVKAALIETAKSKNLSADDLAARLGMWVAEAATLLDPWTPSSVDKMTVALKALGGPALEVATREVA